MKDNVEMCKTQHKFQTRRRVIEYPVGYVEVQHV